LDCLCAHDFSSRNADLLNLQHYVIREKKLSEKESIVIFYDTVRVVDSLHKVVSMFSICWIAYMSTVFTCPINGALVSWRMLVSESLRLCIFIQRFMSYNGYVLFCVCTYALFMIIRWVAFLLHIQVVPSSNLSSGFISLYAFSSSFQACGRIVPHHFCPHPFQFIIQ
jgi:hypothetical protein